MKKYLSLLLLLVPVVAFSASSALDFPALGVGGGGGGASVSWVGADTSNGMGSTNNKVRKFSVARTPIGSDLTLHQSATLGWHVEVTGPGITNALCRLEWAYDGNTSGSYILGFSKNTTQGSTSIDSITAADVISLNEAGVAGKYGSVSGETPCSTGDLLYPHSDGVPNVATSRTTFSVSLTR